MIHALREFAKKFVQLNFIIVIQFLFIHTSNKSKHFSYVEKHNILHRFKGDLKTNFNLLS